MVARRPPKELRRVAFSYVITPSNINPWRGSRAEGDQFTGEQLRAMAYRGIDPTTIAVVEVRSSVSQREMWWPTGDAAPVLVQECPVIGKRGERLLVLSPAGMAKLVWPDGSIQRPRQGRAR